MPWHPGGAELGLAGIYQYSEREWQATGMSTGGVGRMFHDDESQWQAGVASRAVAGTWGLGECCDVLITHGPVAGILDTIDASRPPFKPHGRPCGCKHLLAKLMRMRQPPALVASGHVHAEQGQAWLAWKATKAAKDWRKSVKAWFDSNRSEPFPPLPAGMHRTWRAVACGDACRDASCVEGLAVRKHGFFECHATPRAARAEGEHGHG
jgi:hypothetical protein